MVARRPPNHKGAVNAASRHLLYSLWTQETAWSGAGEVTSRRCSHSSAVASPIAATAGQHTHPPTHAHTQVYGAHAPMPAHGPSRIIATTPWVVSGTSAPVSTCRLPLIRAATCMQDLGGSPAGYVAPARPFQSVVIDRYIEHHVMGSWAT